MNRIIIDLEGGVVHDVSGIPKGVEIELRDYDTEGLDLESRLKKDDAGHEYIESIYTDDGRLV